MGRVDQNSIEHIKDMVNLGKMTASQANVEIVRASRVFIVSKLPRDVRSALNEAVRDGLLCHKKKDGLLPEVYYHPSFEYLVNGERSREAERAIKAISTVMVRKSEVEND